MPIEIRKTDRDKFIENRQSRQAELDDESQKVPASYFNGKYPNVTITNQTMLNKNALENAVKLLDHVINETYMEAITLSNFGYLDMVSLAFSGGSYNEYLQYFLEWFKVFVRESTDALRLFTHWQSIANRYITSRKNIAYFIRAIKKFTKEIERAHIYLKYDYDDDEVFAVHVVYYHYFEGYYDEYIELPI